MDAAAEAEAGFDKLHIAHELPDEIEEFPLTPRPSTLLVLASALTAGERLLPEHLPLRAIDRPQLEVSGRVLERDVQEDVVVPDDRRRGLAAAPGSVHFVAADVSVADDIAAVVATALSRTGRLDSAVNAAAIAG